MAVGLCHGCHASGVETRLSRNGTPLCGKCYLRRGAGRP